jgi:DNA polymerase-3 subunit delta'
VARCFYGITLILSLDIWRGYLEAENKQANINIAECHQIIKKLSFKPFESVYKILILWLPEYLDKEGNALLKVIEEPQPNTLFIISGPKPGSDTEYHPVAYTAH